MSYDQYPKVSEELPALPQENPKKNSSTVVTNQIE
jgi:hypothetical protein